MDVSIPVVAGLLARTTKDQVLGGGGRLWMGGVVLT